MKVTTLKRDSRYRISRDTSLGIQAYGEYNDYPQQIIEILDASGTGKSCVNIYQKFISGKGFLDADFYDMVVNRSGLTNDSLVQSISKDLASFGGFAVHVNYNANFVESEHQYMPFETIRFEKLDDNGQFYRYATHPDWGHRYTALRQWKKSDIEWFDRYNPDPIEIQKQVDKAGGWDKYKGQIYYYSNEGANSYPLPIFDSVVTDMNTEEGISNISNRNARNNFSPAGAMVDIISGNDQSDQQALDTKKDLKEFQTDANACKLLYMQVNSKEEIPVFIDMSGKNYDKEYTVTLASSQANIGKAFNQPPILRSEDVGSNFGADALRNAYNFYNSVTSNERLVLERAFAMLHKNFITPSSENFEIDPLSYDVETNVSEMLGTENTAKLIEIVSGTLSDDRKKGLLKVLFGLSDDDINILIPLTL